MIQSAFKEAFEIHRVLLTPAENSPNADIKLTGKEYNDSISAFDEALVLQQSILGDDHKAVLTTMQSIDHAHRLHAEEECCFQISNDNCSIGEC